MKKAIQNIYLVEYLNILDSGPLKGERRISASTPGRAITKLKKLKEDMVVEACTARLLFGGQ